MDYGNTFKPFRLRKTLLAGRIMLEVGEPDPTVTTSAGPVYKWRPATENDLPFPVEYCAVQLGALTADP